MKPRKRLSWKPVRRGHIFCAPACGVGCTHAAYLLAHERANALCASLDRTSGKGWKPHVWENLGWYYNAVSACGRIKVHPHHHGKSVDYTAFLGEAGSGGGTWAEHGKTAAQSVRNVVAMGKRALAKMGAIFNGL
jgi:hypothetical protein